MIDSPPPVGFKDWALVCAALAAGRQSIILRKGGIAEGRDGFHFKHEQFFLFPTQYHQQAAKVRPEVLASLHPAPPAPEGTVRIESLFVVERAIWIDDWETLGRLEPFHVWREEVVRERFDYGETTGVQCAIGRTYRLDRPWGFPDRPAYGGCRSWVNLPRAPADMRKVPVINDAQHSERMQQLLALVGEPLLA